MVSLGAQCEPAAVAVDDSRRERFAYFHYNLQQIRWRPAPRAGNKFEFKEMRFQIGAAALERVCKRECECVPRYTRRDERGAFARPADASRVLLASKRCDAK